MKPSPLLLVVGMHRSGTSLLGSLLTRCGVTLPGQLLCGDAHNPEGYFERADVTSLQEQLLIDLDRWWPSPHGMTPLPERWITGPSGQQAIDDLCDLLRQEASQQQGSWAIKDPRSSLLLPLWKQACNRLEIPLNLLLAIRDPAEVVVSLVQRDHATTGMDSWRAQRLWWHHNAEVLRHSGDLPRQVVSYSRWFEPKHALQQLSRIAPQLSRAEAEKALQAVRSEHRRSERHREPTLLAPSVLRLYRRLDRLAGLPVNDQPTELDLIAAWAEKTQALNDVQPLKRRRSRIKHWVKSTLHVGTRHQTDTHPWSYLSQIVCGSDRPAASHQINYWEKHGFRAFELERFSRLPGPCIAAEAWHTVKKSITIQLRGELDQWGTYSWLQHCPVSQNITQVDLEPLGAQGTEAVALNLVNLVPGAECSEELLRLAELDVVWDPDPQRVILLRQFGIRAYWLAPKKQSHPALQGSDTTWGHCETLLGLPNPTALKKLGTTLCLGHSTPELEQELHKPLLGIPGFAGMPISSASEARLISQWLQECLNQGLELVCFKKGDCNSSIQDWRGLIQVNSSGNAPILRFPDAISRSELLNELQWYRSGQPQDKPLHTPSPPCQVLGDYTHDTSSISVCISLYNYESRIATTLTSVSEQTDSHKIELIIVDDASTDASVANAHNWIEHYHDRFGRCLLLKHQQNGGLASARNTAFSQASTPWCFVLDADNHIHPNAISHLETIAKAANPKCAVIHSLIEICSDSDTRDYRHLVSDRPWIRDLFKSSNYIDAMALVRKSAWADVGGYTHIPGGWEDYDFWCCLVDKGWHGVLCPEILATYTSHISSMRNRSTNQKSYALSRLLQSRHPWLQLEQAKDHAIQSFNDGRH